MSKSGIFAIENELPLYLDMPQAYDIVRAWPKMSDAQDERKLPQNMVGKESSWESYVPLANWLTFFGSRVRLESYAIVESRSFHCCVQ